VETGFISPFKNIISMKKKLNNILLIDDSQADNFISYRIINKSKVAEAITLTYGAKEALEYLSKSANGQFPKPEIIFLDINMPDMSGWDFLDEYKLLDKAEKAEILCMLTTSKANSDREKAAQYEIVNHFSTKPLNKEELMLIIKQYFSDYV